MANPTASFLCRIGVIMLSSLLGACTNLALKAINTPSYVSADIEVEKDLVYGSQEHQKLDLYFPPESGNRNRQLVIFVYGGDWTSGSRENYFFVADALTSAGYTVAIPDYIKYPEGVFPAFVQDIALAVDWLATNIGRFADVDTLILIGHSAGAHIAALLVTDRRYLAAHELPEDTIDAFVGLAGPYAYLPQEEKYRDIFGRLEDYRGMQPLHFVSGSEPPMLLLHGSQDKTVLPVHTRKFAEKVNALGGSAATRFYPQRKHAGMVLALSRISGRSNEIRSAIMEFLQQALPGDQPAGE
jgi:acetyl esterase/lipase